MKFPKKVLIGLGVILALLIVIFAVVQQRKEVLAPQPSWKPPTEMPPLSAATGTPPGYPTFRGPTGQPFIKGPTEPPPR